MSADRRIPQPVIVLPQGEGVYLPDFVVPSHFVKEFQSLCLRAVQLDDPPEFRFIAANLINDPRHMPGNDVLLSAQHLTQSDRVLREETNVPFVRLDSISMVGGIAIDGQGFGVEDASVPSDYVTGLVLNTRSSVRVRFDRKKDLKVSATSADDGKVKIYAPSRTMTAENLYNRGINLAHIQRFGGVLAVGSEVVDEFFYQLSQADDEFMKVDLSKAVSITKPFVLSPSVA